MIKEIDHALKGGDTLIIEDKVVKTLDDFGEKHNVCEITIYINDIQIISSFYSEKERKQLYLVLSGGVKLNVEVLGKIISNFNTYGNSLLGICYSRYSLNSRYASGLTRT